MFARTERLLLRPAFREDAPALLKAIGDDLIVRHVADGRWPSTVAEAEALIEEECKSLLPNLLIFRRTRGASKLVGAVGLERDEAGEIELRLWITKEHWGLGFATEASKAMLALARDGLRLDAIMAGHFADSPAGERVLRKLGFEPTGATVQRTTRCRVRPAAWRKYELKLAGAAHPMLEHRSLKLMAA